MSYGKDIYIKAMDELRQRKNNAELLAETKSLEFFSLCPEAENIQMQKASTAAKIAITVFSGTENVRDALEKLKENSQRLQSDFNKLLAKHNMTEKDVTPQYTCEKCKDTGFVDGFMCACLKSLQKQLAYEDLNMNAPLSECTFENFDVNFYDGAAAKQMQLIYDYCRKYASLFNARSPSLLFRGSTGLGKTHLSLAIASAAIEKGFGVIYASAQTFAVGIEKERFSKDDASAPLTTEQKMQNCDLLIIDDLGVEFTSSYVNAALYNIINARLLASAPTIISTNLSIKELETKYSKRFVSRVTGQYSNFEFIGSDIRILKRKKQRDAAKK
jgi:DNA replication protein